MEKEERWTGEGYRQPAYDYGSNVQKLDESCQALRGHCGIRRDGVGATGRNGAVLASGEMRRAVVMSLARLFALVLRCKRGAVRFPGKLAPVPDDDENRREER